MNVVDKDKAVIRRIRQYALSGDFDLHLQLLWSECEAIRRYLHSFRLEDASGEFIAQYVNDAMPRFFHTLKLMPAIPKARVLELGANPYLFTILLTVFREYQVDLANFFSKNIYEQTVTRGVQAIRSREFDESFDFSFSTFNMELGEYPYPDNHFDLVLFCEILEHLIIDPLKVFEKIRRMLKPGGRLVLTTPNAVRLINVASMLSGSNIFDRYHPENGVYGRHNREFTLEEVVRLLESNALAIESAETLDRYNYDFSPMIKDNYEAPGRLAYSRDRLIEILQASGSPVSNRGDNIYVVARKN